MRIRFGAFLTKEEQLCASRIGSLSPGSLRWASWQSRQELHHLAEWETSVPARTQRCRTCTGAAAVGGITGTGIVAAGMCIHTTMDHRTCTVRGLESSSGRDTTIGAIGVGDRPRQIPHSGWREPALFLKIGGPLSSRMVAGLWSHRGTSQASW
jgi:hypothetical protein